MSEPFGNPTVSIKSEKASVGLKISIPIVPIPMCCQIR